VTRRSPPALLLLLAGSVGCSTANLYPITRDPPGEAGGTSGTSGSSGDGGNGGTGNGGTGNGGTGNGGNAGNSGSSGASACPSPPLEPGDTDESLLVGSVRRTYVLHVPPAYDGTRAVPLVVDFHGLGESGASQRASSPYPAVLDPEGVVMAFPDGLRGPAGTAWNVGPCCVADVDDIAFARALVARVRELTCIDPIRVYAVGVLTGGGLTYQLACQAADLFAAVSPSAFDLLEENVDLCEPARPISVVAFRGTASTRVPYTGGASALVPGMPLTFLGAQETYEKWAEIDRCVGPKGPVNENGCSAYSGCADGAEVILCTDDGREEDGDPSIAWPVLSRHTL
jgi:polyhydroxybutyrate depolymerase